jgi:tungstate transport system substrate-binding protein
MQVFHSAMIFESAPESSPTAPYARPLVELACRQAALNVASASNAYVLSDRGTWLAFKNRGDLTIVVEGDKRLFNQYGVMLVAPAKCPNVKEDAGQQFIDWLVSPEGQKIIAGYKINGQHLFYPNASDPNAL